MKFIKIFFLSFLFISPAFSQKLIINEIGFKLKEEERNSILMLAQYEAKLFNGLFDTEINDSLTITLNLYAKSKDYNKILKEAGIHNPGFYSPKLKQVFMLYQGIDHIGTTLHEMSHAFLHNNMKNPPKWLNEGLAMFFSTLSVVQNNVQVSTLPHHIKYVKDQIASNNINLYEFLNRGNSSWAGKTNQEYMYPVSYSVVFYMISNNPEMMKKVISELKNKNNIETIFNAIYGGVDRFESNYRFFYKYKFNS